MVNRKMSLVKTTGAEMFTQTTDTLEYVESIVCIILGIRLNKQEFCSVFLI